MLFSSLPFFLFFAVYLLLHLTIPARWRLGLIILGSTFFYGYWDYRFTPLPYCLLAIAYIGVWWMGRTEVEAARRNRMIATVALLLAPLIFFKYVNFLYRDVYGVFFPLIDTPLVLDLPLGSTLTLFPTTDKLIETVLPLGISFVTFTFIGYTVDVYWRTEQPEPRLGVLTSAVMFFPHLIAGPVVLPKQLIWQMESPRTGLRAEDYLNAVLIFAFGLMKKLIFADQLAAVVNPVFRHEYACTSLDYALAIVGFSVQIYCDFSGYSDMAIGLAKLLGVELPKNFERPYTADSIVDFWQRWHITLSSWLRNYLYIPLGGNRHGITRQIINVMITMGLGGLWHGARWTFVVWGLAHGAVIALTHLLRYFGWKQKLALVPRGFWVVLTFLFVTLTWIPFRAENMTETWSILSGVFTAGLPDLGAFAAKNAFPLVLLAVFFLTHRYDYHKRVKIFAYRAPLEWGWAMVMFLMVLSVCISAGGSADFIYFDF